MLSMVVLLAMFERPMPQMMAAIQPFLLIVRSVVVMVLINTAEMRRCRLRWERWWLW